jgi:hypothetical protein
MYMRLAGCVAGIVGMLGWEAATAAHPTLHLKANAPIETGNPLVALSEGVIATPSTPAVQHDRERTWSLAPARQQGAQPCNVAAVSCSQPIKEDAGVAPVSASPSACKGAGKG